MLRCFAGALRGAMPLAFFLPLVLLAPSSAPPSPTRLLASKVTVQVYVDGIDDGCNPSEPWCEFDGIIDFTGPSATEATDSAASSSSLTIGGAAVNAWEGTGSIDLEARSSYVYNQVSINGSGAGSPTPYVAYSLDVTYHPVSGPSETWTREAHYAYPPSVWDASVPAFDGQLGSVDLDLEVLGRGNLLVERTLYTCGLTTATSTTEDVVELWRL